MKQQNRQLQTEYEATFVDIKRIRIFNWFGAQYTDLDKKIIKDLDLEKYFDTLVFLPTLAC
ncbi:MAG: hypothetical protein CL685_01630 [Candidatus Magasanikbacteria bacterium]|nr:hypothetical protein [Candidatus Magasanikbacteria bacterium]|tara:strand:- start:4910 stop:5092 length:183 start_codon:yes stop_codon:yes gene_type:complete